jgi:hypothetical protein
VLHTFNNEGQESTKSADRQRSQNIENNCEKFLPICEDVFNISHAHHAGVFNGVAILVNFEVFHYVDIHSVKRVFAFGFAEN